MKSGIYQITNQVNGKRYVGSSVNLTQRWRDHLGALCHSRHRNSHLQASFNKYGKDAFTFSALEYTEVGNLIEREQYYLDSLRPEYNISPTAGSPLGFRHTAEARAKMSAARMGKHPSAETLAKISGERNHNYGKHRSAKTRAKISATRMGQRPSDETRAKLSAAQRGRIVSDETRAKMRASAMGHSISDTTRMKISAALSGERNPNYGKHFSNETRAKMSEARKAWWCRFRMMNEE